MAGPQSIQRTARGLLDLLGMKATGAQTAGSEFSATTSGSIDVTQLYTLDRQRGWRGTTAVAPAAVGFLISSQGQPPFPPPGEIWLVFDASIIMPPIAAATAWKGALAVQRAAPFATQSYTLLTDELNLPASTGGGTGRCFERPVILQAGDQIGIYTTSITGAPGQQPILGMKFCPVVV